MTGSLQIKNGKYYAVINTTDSNGKRKQKWVCSNLDVKGNKKNADKFLRDTIKDFEMKADNVRSDILFSDYIRYWLDLIKISVDEVTYQGYSKVSYDHVLPYFEKLNFKITDIDRLVLQKYFNDKYTNGRKDGKGGLSAKTLRMHKIIIRQTLGEAVKNGLIPNNPIDTVVLPQLQRYDYTFYTEEQLHKLFEAIKDEPLYPLIRVTVLYGLRRSEVLGLKWDSVNLNNNTITIKHTVSKVSTVVKKDKTKNRSSYRTFPLIDEVKDIFLEAKRKEEENMKLFGSCYIKNDYIFKWDSGEPYLPDYVTRTFVKLLKKNDLPHIRFHDLRHSCASLLIALGFTLKDIQEWLGHADIQTTANIYAHLDIERKNNIANAMRDSLKS